MKILSFHPFSLFANGGGSRILRRIYQGHEPKIASLIIQSTCWIPPSGNIDETVIPAFPLVQSWMRWHVRGYTGSLQRIAFKSRNAKRIQREAARVPCDVLHVVNHGPFSDALREQFQSSGKPVWVSFHDHFATTESTYQDAKLLWQHADRRLVISESLGMEYNRLFGCAPYEIITDGLLPDEISNPAQPGSSDLTIYFAGLLHIDYLPLFRALADAMDLLFKQGLKMKLILRGTQHISFLQDRLFETEYRPFSTDEKELKQEMNAATVLYLPIKFNQPEFYLYSLSTKMVGYLGASGTILYHGPTDSAASSLLMKTRSALCCHTLNSIDLLEAIKFLCKDKRQYSTNAKRLAMQSFDLNLIRKRFWN